VCTSAQTFVVFSDMLGETTMTDTTIRSADLRRMLSERRREIQDEVQGRIRDGRGGRQLDVRDALEHSDADSQGDIDLALLQIKAETLTRIDQALVRLDAGTYGSCFECKSEIAARRLQALPFAVRCQACEQRREQEHGRARQLAQQRGRSSLFPELAGS
jgi:DnaK suppressor protein